MRKALTAEYLRGLSSVREVSGTGTESLPPVRSSNAADDPRRSSDRHDRSKIFCLGRVLKFLA